MIESSQKESQDATSVPHVAAGEFPFFIRKILGLRSQYRFRYDDVTKLSQKPPCYLLTHEKDVQHVLVSNAGNYKKTLHLSSAEGRERVGDGLISRTGDRHLQHRRLLQPAFYQSAIEKFGAVVAGLTDQMLVRWTGQEIIDVGLEMTRLAQDVVVGSLFGIDFVDENRAFAAAIDDRRRYTEYIYHSRLPFRKKLPTKTVRDYRRGMVHLDKTIYAQIEKNRRSDGRNDSFVDMLCNMTGRDGTTLSDKEIRDEVLTLTSTGYETVGEALTWSWFLIGQHGAVESQWMQELDDVLGGKPPTAGNVGKLEYTEMILSESMRLYPPTWVFVRIPIDDDVLPSGAAVEKNAKLYLCQYVMNRHPAHFPNPETFDPRRFNKAVKPVVSRHVYFPFGGGAHRCIGEAFAVLEAKMVLARVAQQLEIVPIQPEKVRAKAGITLRPAKPLLATIRAR